MKALAQAVPDKEAAFDLLKGDIVTLAVGGGYGPVAERSQQRIHDDVEDGFISDRLAATWTCVS